MSADSPPTYYFTGIQFNSSFYADVSTSPLTQSQATALYLLKNSADTATALETFTGGVLINSISPTTTSSTISLNSSKIGSTNADPAIAIATSDLTRTIKLGNESGTNQNSIHLASLDVTYHGLNNITGTTGIVQIGNKQTTLTGVLNLGCSTAGNVRVDAPINIGTDTTTTGVITIGSSNATQSTVVKNADVRMGTGKNITLSSGTVAPSSTQLGYLKVGTVKASGTVINNGNTNIGDITLDAGSWIINAYCNINPVSITTDNVGFRYSINTTSASAPSTTYLLMGSEGTTYTAISTSPTLAGTAMISITASQTYYLNLNVAIISGSATLGTVTHWNAMRIG